MSSFLYILLAPFFFTQIFLNLLVRGSETILKLEVAVSILYNDMCWNKRANLGMLLEGEAILRCRVGCGDNGCYTLEFYMHTYINLYVCIYMVLIILFSTSLSFLLSGLLGTPFRFFWWGVGGATQVHGQYTRHTYNKENERALEIIIDTHAVHKGTYFYDIPLLPPDFALQHSIAYCSIHLPDHTS